MRMIGVLVVVLAISACITVRPSNAPPSNAVAWTLVPLASGEVALPTEPPIISPSGVPIVCGGVGLDAILEGDANDPRVAWLVSSLNGPALGGPAVRIDVVWPAGYRARFGPGLVVLDASDTIRLRAGDRVGGACRVLPDGRMYLQPPFE